MRFVGFPSANELGDGRKAVTTAGTRVPLSASAVPCCWIILTALSGNTGTVVVGSSTVVASLATRRGMPLDASDSVNLSVTDLNAIYLDSAVDGEGVTFVYGK